MLDAVREASTCPLCHIEQKSLERYFEALLHESVNDVGVREALARSQGYCARHAHYLRRHGNALGTAILYRDQVRLFLESLKGHSSRPKAVARSKGGEYVSPEKCPACLAQRAFRDRYVRALLDSISEEAMREALESSRGLCVPHFEMVLNELEESVERTRLISIQRSGMESLLEELQEFHRKHDHRFCNERFGDESDSWIRAITMMAGDEGLF